jgi:hypothetical protein
VPADRTLVTELSTALGTLPSDGLDAALGARSPVLHLDGGTWGRLEQLRRAGAYARDFESAYRNGAAFAAAVDGLGGRPPRIIEWTGGRRPAGDEVAPIDLRIDRVYLVSCKYLSANIANASPGRLFDGLLATTGEWERGDWYQLVAPDEHEALYAACAARAKTAGDVALPPSAQDLTAAARRRLRRALGERGLPEEAQRAYQALCDAVSERSAARWLDRLAAFDDERMVWRLLRVGNAPYFLLGAHGRSSLRLRVDTTWDWHRAYRLDRLTVTAARAGQPRVDWSAAYKVRGTDEARVVKGHVEIRWSHGRFGQPPEAKVYLDTPVDEVPGYHPLAGAAARTARTATGSRRRGAHPDTTNVELPWPA